MFSLLFVGCSYLGLFRAKVLVRLLHIKFLRR